MRNERNVATSHRPWEKMAVICSNLSRLSSFSATGTFFICYSFEVAKAEANRSYAMNLLRFYTKRIGDDHVNVNMSKEGWLLEGMWASPRVRQMSQCCVISALGTKIKTFTDVTSDLPMDNFAPFKAGIIRCHTAMLSWDLFVLIFYLQRFQRSGWRGHATPPFRVTHPRASER